jgi:antitoxin (DNA-binding transcriptional repressor) of toxin-antitoxin stability system
MRFVSVRELRGSSAETWRKLAEERELVVTSNGKPFAILSAVSEENLEESLAAFRRARAISAVDTMQMASVKAGTNRMSLREINAEIDAVRSKRAK